MPDYRWVAKVVVALMMAARLSGAAVQSQGTPSDGATFHLLEATVAGIQAALRSGQISCQRLVELYLKRIEAYNQAGPRLNAVQNLNPRAVQEAQRLDATFRASGPAGSLHCIPVLVKDQVETMDMPTTYGSAVFQNFVPQRDASIVTRLKKAGALILAKTTMGEFATSFIGSAFGIVRNPYDPKRNPSGSSAGTGAGIAANFAALGIGEDTGGSIRGPAAVASLVGLRPTVPLVSRYGMMPARPSTDTLGPITRTVRDAALLLDVIAGYDPSDPVTAYAIGQLPATYTEFLLRDGLQGARLGVLREPMDPKVDIGSDDYKKVQAVIERALTDLKRLGAVLIDPVTIPELKDRLRKVLQENAFETEQAMNDYLEGHPEAPVKTVREILLTGKVVPRRASQLMNIVGRSTDELGYLQVLLAKEETRQVVLQLMADQRLDAILYATFDYPPAVIAADILTNPDPQIASSVGNNRRLSPVLGFPALTVPAGFTTDGLPVGLEFMARPFAEGALFKLGYAYEQGTRHRKPPKSAPPLPGEP